MNYDVVIFSMGTHLLDREWSGYLFNEYTDIGQRIEKASFLWEHWICTENGVGIFPNSDIGQTIEWESLLGLILDREWSGHLSNEYTAIGQRVE